MYSSTAQKKEKKTLPKLSSHMAVHLLCFSWFDILEMHLNGQRYRHIIEWFLLIFDHFQMFKMTQSGFFLKCFFMLLLCYFNCLL